MDIKIPSFDLSDEEGIVTFQKSIRERAAIVIKELEQKTIEREVLSRILLLALLSKSNIFLIGAPGVAKSYILKLVSNCIVDGKYFEYLVSPTTKPVELLGVPYEAENGEIRYNTKDSVVDSHIVFLDELYKGNSSIMNAMLGIASDNREYHQRGSGDGGVVKTEVRCLMSASNEFPSSEELAAFDDRLHIKYEVLRISAKENFLRFMRGEFDKTHTFSTGFSIAELDTISMLSEYVQVPSYIDDILYRFRERYIREKLKASDRKIGNTARIMKVSAFCNGRSEIDISDLFLLLHTTWSDYYERDRVREVCFDIFFKSEDFYKSEITKLDNMLDEQFGVIESRMEDVLHKRVNLKPENINKNFSIWRQNAKTLSENLQSFENAYRELLNIFDGFVHTEKLVRQNIFLVDLLEEEALSIRKPYRRSFDEDMISHIEGKIVLSKKMRKRLEDFFDRCQTPSDYTHYIAA